MGTKLLWLRSKVKANLRFRVKNGSWLKYFFWERTWQNETCHDRLLQKVHLKFPKVIPFERSSCQICRKKQHMLFTAMAFSITDLLSNQKLVINIQLMHKEVCECQCLSIWFSVHLFNQIKMQTFPWNFCNFHNDWRRHDSVLV